MKVRKIINKAQSTLEYIAVILAIIGVFVAMQKYYQRSLQGTFRQAGDAIGGGEQSD
ncbi:MAG: hypothetical protein WC543_00970 [Candidatus Omnitrophota bacterium]